MTVSCANWMKMSVSVRLQSVMCFCTNHHQYAACVALRTQDWVDPSSHQMITDTSNASRATDTDASSAAPQISALRPLDSLSNNVISVFHRRLSKRGFSVYTD